MWDGLARQQPRAVLLTRQRSDCWLLSESVGVLYRDRQCDQHQIVLAAGSQILCYTRIVCYPLTDRTTLTDVSFRKDYLSKPSQRVPAVQFKR